MNTEQERAAFEAFESKHGLCVTKEGELYRSHVVAWMWKAWQARAALQSQDKEDAALRQHITNLTAIVRMPNAEYVADKHNDAVKYLRAKFIDHARRIEGDGE